MTWVCFVLSCLVRRQWRLCINRGLSVTDKRLWANNRVASFLFSFLANSCRWYSFSVGADDVITSWRRLDTNKLYEMLDNCVTGWYENSWFIQQASIGLSARRMKIFQAKPAYDRWNCQQSAGSIEIRKCTHCDQHGIIDGKVTMCRCHLSVLQEEQWEVFDLEIISIVRYSIYFHSQELHFFSDEYPGGARTPNARCVPFEVSGILER